MRGITFDAMVDVAKDKPEDYVIATGRMESVREFINICSKKLHCNKNEESP